MSSFPITFREIFNFEGSEFYLSDLPGIDGLSFEDVMVRLNYAVPTGVYRDGKTIMNPPASFQLVESDKILVFSEDGDSAKLETELSQLPAAPEAHVVNTEDLTDTIIIGHNETLPVILNELPENVTQVYLVGQETTQEEQDELQRVAADRNLNLNYYYKGNPRSERVLLELAKIAEHIVILNDHNRDPEEADMDVIFMLLNLRDIRKRYDLKFNITVEMQKEHNQKLVGRGDHTDFLVASSMSSLILAQLAEKPGFIYPNL